MDDTPIEQHSTRVVSYHYQHGKRQLTKSQGLQEENSLHRRGAYQQIFSSIPNVPFPQSQKEAKDTLPRA